MPKMQLTFNAKKDDKTDLYFYKIASEDEVISVSTPKYGSKEEAYDAFKKQLQGGEVVAGAPRGRAKKRRTD